MKDSTKDFIKFRPNAKFIEKVDHRPNYHYHQRDCVSMAINEAKAYGVNWVSGWLVDNFREDINATTIIHHCWNVDSMGNHYDTLPAQNKQYDYVQDEDVTFMGSRTGAKVETKKETTITITRKKDNNCWESVFNSARHGIDTADTYHGLTNPGRSDYGYRVFLKLKTDGQVLTMTNACVMSHTVTVNTDGVTEETMEFMSYLQPLITTGAASTDPQSDTTVF